MAYELLPWMTPWIYGELCPAEVKLLMDAARKRDEKQWWQVAWSLSHLLNIAGKTLKTRVTPAKLLGRVVSRSSKDAQE